MGDTDERRYWPDGVKLDSKIIFNSDGEPVRHEARWILTWESTNHFFFTDYYAHDLYLEKEGGTFLDPNSTSIRTADTTLPLTGLYRFNDGPNRLRVGWATYRPSFIEAGTIYTVTIESSVVDTPPIDYAVEDIETYGIRIPSICNGTNLPCLWWPTSWCSIAPGGNTLQLFNNGHPNGIFPLGTPLGGCNTLYYLFLPILTTQ